MGTLVAKTSAALDALMERVVPAELLSKDLFAHPEHAHAPGLAHAAARRARSSSPVEHGGA